MGAPDPPYLFMEGEWRGGVKTCFPWTMEGVVWSPYHHEAAIWAVWTQSDLEPADVWKGTGSRRG